MGHLSDWTFFRPVNKTDTFSTGHFPTQAFPEWVTSQQKIVFAKKLLQDGAFAPSMCHYFY